MVISLATDNNNTNSAMMSSVGSGIGPRALKCHALRDLQRRTPPERGMALLSSPLTLCAHIEAIIDMLHFNTSMAVEATLDGDAADGLTGVGGGAATLSAPSEASVWKVLVLDSAGQKILSPIMKVNDLRDHGVTLYLYLQRAPGQCRGSSSLIPHQPSFPPPP